ncbi:MAG: glycerate kinase [Bacteroidales bacterium]|nr:glycerate kinase [Bacteroidales bacterium]
MKKVIVAVDSFKGSLTSAEANLAVESGINALYPECDVKKVSVADGGEGTTAAIIETLSGEWREVEVHDPLMRAIKAKYGIINGGKCAVIEVASASGLTLLSNNERDPLKSSSYGFGEMIDDAINLGCREFIIGIGGSATCDAGVGMLEALGYSFFDGNGDKIKGLCGGKLSDIKEIRDGNPLIKECLFKVACDVENPLYGENGAAHIFAPQKGATPEMVEILESGIINFSKIITEKYGREVANLAGGGAAGGIGATLYSLFNASLENGISMILNSVNFDTLLSDTQLVITGEGKIDNQTLMGKVPFGILQAAKKKGVKCVAICGIYSPSKELEECGFEKIIEISPRDLPLEEVMQKNNATRNIESCIIKFINSMR